MREAMMNAIVGDDCYGEDPTVNRLEELAAEKMGKEAGMYVPTGTMGNTAALLTHVCHGDAVIMEPDCHIYYYERGNVSAIAGALPVLISGEGGCPDADLVEDAIQRNGNRPKTTLICLENTHNRACGRAIPVQKMKVIQNIAKKYDVPIHLDGARIFNAAIALGVDPIRKGIMDAPPRNPGEPIITKSMATNIVIISILMAAGVLFLFNRFLSEGRQSRGRLPSPPS